ncbi:MAG: serine/threonine protein kinase, partial [Actinobacteria bacterium]|nr:serine/threonine protein kinase [Actinomycetota bacterium]
AVAAPLADALASAHRRDVLHCDVKPANVLFTSDGEPLLSDFGVARRFASAVTADQVVAGTAEYLAPELLDGGRPDVRSDVYSLGVVCYEALTGSPPYTGDSPLAVVRAADRGHHARLGTVAGVPPALAEAVERAMARDPSDRYPGAGELARGLRGALDPGDVVLPPVAGARPAVPRPSDGQRRHGDGRRSRSTSRCRSSASAGWARSR